MSCRLRSSVVVFLCIHESTSLSLNSITSLWRPNKAILPRRSPDIRPIHTERALKEQTLDPEDFLSALSSKVLKYVSGQPDTTAPTVKFAGPSKISDAFAAVGCPLPVGSEPVDAQRLLAATDKIMEYSVRTSSPLFNNQLYGTADPIAIAGDMMVAGLNPSSYTYEVAPVFSLMETELIVKLGGTLGGQFADRDIVDGLFVPGGSICNLYALHVARHRACPEAKTEGNSAAGGPLCAFVSDEAHYSYEKAFSLMGLGSKNMYKVPTDPVTGAMDPKHLQRLMLEAKNEGKVPFFVGCTAGTTVLGAFDPVDEVTGVVESFNSEHGAKVWTHVDGAWGGASIFSKRTSEKYMTGAERADSFSISFHKMLGAPQQSNCFMTKHPGLLMETNSLNAAYLFQPDKEYGELDYGDKTFQCGRKVDTLKVWLMWKYLGDVGLENRVDYLCDLADYMSEKIQTTVDAEGRRCFVQVSPTSLSNVVFYAIPPSLRVAPGSPTESDSELIQRLDLEALAKVGPAVKSEMQRRGNALITYQNVKQFPNCWRMVFAGAKDYAGMSTDTVDEILDSMRTISSDIFG